MTIQLKKSAAVAGVRQPQGAVLNLTDPEEHHYVTVGLAEYVVPPDNVRAAYGVTTRLDPVDNVLGFSVGPSGRDYLGWEDLRFPAQGINPAGTASPPSIDTTTYPGTLLFAHNANNIIAGVAQMPHGWARATAIRPHVHWAKTTSAAGGVVWEWSYAVANIGEQMPAMSDWIAATDAVGSDDTAGMHAMAAWPTLDMDGLRESCCMIWQIRRNTDAAGDTYAADARFIEFDIHYQMAKFGTTKEYPTA